MVLFPLVQCPSDYFSDFPEFVPSWIWIAPDLDWFFSGCGARLTKKRNNSDLIFVGQQTFEFRGILTAGFL